MVGVHQRNICTKFEANPCMGLRKVEKQKVHDQRRTQGDCQSYTHSLSVTKKGENITKFVRGRGKTLGVNCNLDLKGNHVKTLNMKLYC